MARRWTTSLRTVAASIAIVALATGCNNPFSSDSGTRIRLRNASAFELTNVTFRPGQPKLEFDRIRPGEATNYVTVPNSYGYGYLEVLVNGSRRVIQPIDYVGESYIGDGRFTFEITVESSTLNPSTRLVKDD